MTTRLSPIVATFSALLLFVSGADAQAPAAVPENVSPLYVATYIDVRPAAREEAAVLLRAHRDATRAEAGNLRTLVVRSVFRPGQFVMLTTWVDQKAWDAHLATSATVDARATLKSLRSAPMDDRLNRTLSVGPLEDPGVRGAVYAVTHVDVVPQGREDAVAILKVLADANRQANGNLRYEVVQQANRPNHFTVFEIWRSRAAFDANIAAPAQREFRDRLGVMTGALYDERLYELLK
jgi:quinol monooxygenase YgiN